MAATPAHGASYSFNSAKEISRVASEAILKTTLKKAISISVFVLSEFALLLLYRLFQKGFSPSFAKN